MYTENLTKCEELVLMAIWDAQSKISARKILDEVNLKYEKNWKIQTMSTFLQRLVNKGYVEKENTGRNTCYAPRISLREYQKQKLSEMKEFLFGGNTGEMAEILFELGMKKN